MDEQKQEPKIYIAAIVIVACFLIFFLFFAYISYFHRTLPQLETSDYDTALRGSIITNDGFSVTKSQKLYKAMVNTRNIDPNKKELFIKLYSLYSGDSPKEIRKILNSRFGVVTLSYKISAKKAAYLKDLARKLYRKKVFIPYEDKKTGSVSTQGLSILESGEKRIYMAKDTLTPVVGYTRKIEKNNITKVKGVKGIEQVYDPFLSSTKDEIIKGPRDLANTIILSGDATLSKRQDGFNIVLKIPLKLQKTLEEMADKEANFLIAREVVIGIMEAKTGKILALVSTNRYNPENITKNDYEALNSTASEYAYEMGSVIKPLVFALLLKENLVNPFEIINTYGGKYKLGNRVIKDSHKSNFLSAEDVIVKSSNIGMIQLISRLENFDLLNGLKNFGLAQKTGIDLSYEQSGILPTLDKLRNATYKGALSYGYGLQATFMQILTAYNTINNNGLKVSPKIVDHLEKNSKRYSIRLPKPQRILPIETAKTIKRILVKTVRSPYGTAKKAYIKGLTIGAKTGTAHIAVAGGYSNKRYNASFFGFVNDHKGNNYTIGVLVREPMRSYPYYFASWSALPIFKKTVEILVESGYLFPDENAKDESIYHHKVKEILD